MGSDSQNREVERIAGELQASIRKARVQRPRMISSARITVPQSAFEPDGAIELELAVLRSSYDIAGAPFTSHRRFLGRFIIFFKNIAREVLLQLLARQSAYNGAAVRAIAHLKQRQDTIAEEQRRIAQRLAALEARIGAQLAERSDSSEPANAFGTDQFHERLNALEKTAATGENGVRGNG